MGLESRFQTGFREAPNNAPGLLMDDNDDVWLVLPNGSRVRLTGGGGSSFPTYYQLEAPGSPSDGDTWMRPSEGHGDYPNHFGIGTFRWDGNRNQWDPIGAVVLNDDGTVAGQVTVGPDGGINIEHFADDGAVGFLISGGSTGQIATYIGGQNVAFMGEGGSMTFRRAVKLAEVAEPDPDSGASQLYTDSSDHLLKAMAEDGTVTVLAGISGGGLSIYGSGTDGDHVCVDGETIQSGMYHDFTIPDGATVNAPIGTSLAILFCTGTYTINGSIDMTGPDAIQNRGKPDGQAPGQPNAGANGETGDGDGAGYTSIGAGSPGGKGGRGGNGQGGNGAGDAASWLIYNLGHYMAMPQNEVYQYPGGGGGGGAGDGTNEGGGGGGGGRTFIVVARHVVHGPDNQYLCQGGNGADGGWDGGGGGPGNGTCGGGGGGAGGWWMTVSDTLSGSDAAIVGTGGAGGARCGDDASSSSFVGSTVSVPLTIVADVNDNFRWNSLQFQLAPGTYNDVSDLIPAIMTSLYVDDPTRTFEEVIPARLSRGDNTEWTPDDLGGTAIGFDSPTEPNGGAVFNGAVTLGLGDNDVLIDLGFTDGQVSTGGTNGSSDGAPGADPYVVHILNA